jgi:hypothetical protein
MANHNELLTLYNNNQDFKQYIDKCCKTYNKNVDYMLQTKIAESYYQYLIDKQKGKDENQ